MKEPQKHLHAKGCASLVIRLVSSCGEEGSLPDAHSAMRGGADLRFIATKCPTVLCLALKVPVLHFFAMYAWWAQNSSSISSFVGCQQGLISLVIPQSLLIKMLHLQLSIIWKLSSLLRNSKHIKLEGKHRPPAFLSCCGVTLDLHPGVDLWQRNLSISGWMEQMSPSKTRWPVPGFCIYWIGKGIISNYGQKLRQWWMQCKVAMFGLSPRNSFSSSGPKYLFQLWFTPSKISPSSGFTKCDIDNEWTQIKCKIAIGFLRIFPLISSLSPHPSLPHSSLCFLIWVVM